MSDPHDFEERAAILEYCAGYTREEAERLARLYHPLDCAAPWRCPKCLRILREGKCPQCG